VDCSTTQNSQIYYNFHRGTYFHRSCSQIYLSPSAQFDWCGNKNIVHKKVQLTLLPVLAAFTHSSHALDVCPTCSLFHIYKIFRSFPSAQLMSLLYKSSPKTDVHDLHTMGVTTGPARGHSLSAIVGPPAPSVAEGGVPTCWWLRGVK